MMDRIKIEQILECVCNGDRWKMRKKLLCKAGPFCFVCSIFRRAVKAEADLGRA